MHSTLVFHNFLSPETIRLGRFVRNIDDPQSEFFDPDLTVPPESSIVKHLVGYEEAQHNTKDKSFTALLTSLVSTSRSKSNRTSTHVTTEKVKTYQLVNSGSWFKSALKSEAAREWINESIDDGWDIFVVVGYHTMIDAQIVEGALHATDTSGGLQLPVGEALATAGVVMPLGRLADPGLELRDSHQQGVQRRFVAVGEQVCAVQYRKVRFRWFSSHDLGKASLEKDNRWRMYWNVRGRETTASDVIEADLDEEVELEDDNHERHVYDNESFLIQ